MPAICKGSAQVCAVRIARLLPNCTFAVGPNNAAASSAIIRVNASPEYSPGEDFEMKNGCGQLCVSLKNCDQLKRMNLQVELCLRDPAMIELMTGSRTYTDGTDIVGYSRRGIGAACPDSVSMEIWTKAVTTQNTCPVAGGGGYVDAQWWRTIWPKATFTLGDVSFANEVATLQLTGFAEANPNFLNGPFNDVDPLIGVLDPDSPEHMILDQAGPPVLGCGYITTPVQ
jgi:hypothetical protein